MNAISKQRFRLPPISLITTNSAVPYVTKVVTAENTVEKVNTVCTASQCGGINRHLRERDELRELKQKRENSQRTGESAEGISFREGIQEKTAEDQLRDKLLTDLPERHKVGHKVNYFQLNADIITLRKYCKSRRVTNPLSI